MLPSKKQLWKRSAPWANKKEEIEEDIIMTGDAVSRIPFFVVGKIGQPNTRIVKSVNFLVYIYIFAVFFKEITNQYNCFNVD